MSSKPTPPRLDSRGYWFTKWYDDNGKRRQKNFGKAPQVTARVASQRYRNWIVNWHNAPEIRTPGSERILSVDMLVNAYEVYTNTYYRRPDGTPTGEHMNIKYAVDAFAELFGGTPVEEIAAKSLKTYQAHLVEANICRNVINQRCNIIRRMIKWGVAELDVSGAVLASLQAAEGLKAGRSKARESDPVKPVSEDTIAKTLEYLFPQVAAMVRVQWFTACRPSEVCIMRPIDIDMNQDVWVYTPGSDVGAHGRHKNAHHGHNRFIFLGPGSKKVIKPFLQRDVTAYMFTPTEADIHRRRRRHAERKTPMSCGNKPKGVGDQVRFSPCYNRRSYAQAIRRAAIAAKLAPWSPNRLRHTALTRIRKEAGLDAARGVAGHQRVETTQIYAERDYEQTMTLMRRIG